MITRKSTQEKDHFMMLRTEREFANNSNVHFNSIFNSELTVASDSSISRIIDTLVSIYVPITVNYLKYPIHRLSSTQIEYS